jgi:hypothetical protein
MGGGWADAGTSNINGSVIIPFPLLSCLAARLRRRYQRNSVIKIRRTSTPPTAPPATGPLWLRCALVIVVDVDEVSLRYALVIVVDADEECGIAGLTELEMASTLTAMSKR